MSASLTLLGLALASLPLPAQHAASTSVDGFNGLPWGTSAEAIVERFGDPVQRDRLDNGIIVLAYRETLLDLPVSTLYAVLPDRGLVKGQHMFELDLEAGDCEGQYTRLRDHVKFSYPLIAPVENADYPFEVDFCTAVSEGTGEWATQWTDRSTSSIVTVVVERGSEEVKLIYESGLFLDWLGVSLPPEDAEG